MRLLKEFLKTPTGMLLWIPALLGFLSLSLQGIGGGTKFIFQLFALFCGVWLVLFTAHLLSKKEGPLRIPATVTFWIICISLALMFLLFLFVEGLIIYHHNGDKDIPSSANVLLVLGCQVKGETPSEMLGYRIDAAYDYLINHPTTVAVLCGGQGNGEDISEAECMKRELISRGISADRLYTEDRSVNTRENVSFAGEIIREHFPDTTDVVVVSNGFHLLRGKLLCQYAGFNAYGVSARMPNQPILCLNYYLREFAGVFFMYGRLIFA